MRSSSLPTLQYSFQSYHKYSMKRKGDKKQKKNIFTDECTPMHTQSHNDIINVQVWREKTMKLR